MRASKAEREQEAKARVEAFATARSFIARWDIPADQLRAVEAYMNRLMTT